MKERSLYTKLAAREIFQRLSESPDKDLFDCFFNQYYSRLIWFALLFVKQHALAEEVVSDVMMNLFRNRKKLAESSNVEGYIFISVKNQSLKYLRKRKQQVYLDNLERELGFALTTSASPEYVYEEKEFSALIKKAIDSLPPKRRLVFKMVKEEVLRYNDVARLLDLSVKTVETHMGLALKTISEEIRRYQKDPELCAPAYAVKSGNSF